MMVKWGKPVATRTPVQPRYCNYPSSMSDYDRARAKCKNPVTECVGYRRASVMVSKDPEDIELCQVHQRLKFGRAFREVER